MNSQSEYFLQSNLLIQIIWHKNKQIKILQTFNEFQSEYLKTEKKFIGDDPLVKIMF